MAGEFTRGVGGGLAIGGAITDPLQRQLERKEALADKRLAFVAEITKAGASAKTPEAADIIFRVGDQLSRQTYGKGLGIDTAPITREIGAQQERSNKLADTNLTIDALSKGLQITGQPRLAESQALPSNIAGPGEPVPAPDQSEITFPSGRTGFVSRSQKETPVKFSTSTRTLPDGTQVQDITRDGLPIASIPAPGGKPIKDFSELSFGQMTSIVKGLNPDTVKDFDKTLRESAANPNITTEEQAARINSLLNFQDAVSNFPELVEGLRSQQVKIREDRGFFGGTELVKDVLVEGGPAFAQRQSSLPINAASVPPSQSNVISVIEQVRAQGASDAAIRAQLLKQGFTDSQLDEIGLGR